MQIGKIEIKRRVWVALVSAVVVTGLWWNTARVKPPAVAATGPAKTPFVRLTSGGSGAGDQVLREQAELMDPTPLFFPTQWNFGQQPLRESLRRQPGQVFTSFPPNLDFGEKGVRAYGTETVIVPERLEDVLAQGNEAPFAGMGQIDVHRPVLAERSGFVEVRDLILGKDVIAQSLNNISIPHSDFAPVEFLAVVSSAGLVGDPVLVSGSGWEEVDSFLRSYLVKSFKLGERLSPGRYRVLVGP